MHWDRSCVSVELINDFFGMWAVWGSGRGSLRTVWRIENPVLTLEQADNCANVHYDELYVHTNDTSSPPPGFVSHQVANLFLNMACNSRLLPAEDLRTW